MNSDISKVSSSNDAESLVLASLATIIFAKEIFMVLGKLGLV